MVSKQQRDCGGIDHRWHRRSFLEGMAAGGLVSAFSFAGLMAQEQAAEQIEQRGKKCLLLWLCGAPSQFETWDPKPGTATGGPFGSIPTALPGVHFGEMMPKCARIADRLAVIRSMSTEPSEHFQAIDMLTRGEPPRPPFTRPILGSVLAQQLARADEKMPPFVLLDPCPEGNEFKAFKAGDWSGWLGGEFAPVRSGGEFQLKNVTLPPGVEDLDHVEREALRRFLSRRYENERRSEAAGGYNAAFERVRDLMSCAPLFDLENLPERDRERYGPGAFAQHALLARHLLENGSTCVMVANGMPWDCHVLNHEIHQMLVPELDHVVSVLLDDLADRGMLEDTLVLIMGEFGRTPWLNDSRGRDHYPRAWSMAMAGAGVRPGVVYGATDPLGFDVSEQKVDQRRLFATIYRALGIDHTQGYNIPGFPQFHLVEQDALPIDEVLL
ncbi:MAG: DUF1501 domain-containing protein [Planctomycetales bacterium]|nr:DUF1501 domain-containing protein [Planctomycetales bacterium]